MKIHQVGAELFHADGQTDIYDAANTRFSQFCQHAKKALSCYHDLVYIDLVYISISVGLTSS